MTLLSAAFDVSALVFYLFQVRDSLRKYSHMTCMVVRGLDGV